MDPLTGIGLASAVIPFIDFGIKIAARLDGLNSSNPSPFFESFQAISPQLPLLCILRGVVAVYMTQDGRIEGIIEKIFAAPGDSLKMNIMKVFVSLKCDEMVWEIERNLQTAPVITEDHFLDIREKHVLPFVELYALIKQLEGCLYETEKLQAQTPGFVLVHGNKSVEMMQLLLEYFHQAHSLGKFQTAFWLDASSGHSMYLGLEAVCATLKRLMKGSQAEKLLERSMASIVDSS